MNIAKFNLSHNINCLSKLLLVALLLCMGCNSSEVSHGLEPGSPFHPSTNLQILSDSDILDDYDFIQMAIYNQQKDIDMLLSGKAGLSTTLTLNKEKYQNSFSKNKEATERLLVEIKRRGLKPLPQKETRLEPFIFYYFVIDRPSGRSGRTW